MIFYDCLTAPSPRRARMFIAEKGLEIETKLINLGKGEQLSAGFMAVNPRATVPVLVTDEGSVLTENTAIAIYLDKKYPEPPLMGTTADEMGQVIMWNSIAEFSGGLPIADTLRNTSPRMAGRAITGPENFEQIPELATRGKQRVDLFYDMLEEKLQNSQWLAIETFSFADITAFVFVEFARIIKMEIPESNAATLTWHASIAGRSSAKL